jgi:hypothetical protein
MQRRDQDGHDIGFVDLTNAPDQALPLDHRSTRPCPDAPWAPLPENELFSMREYARLRFVRWLVCTGRVGP